MEDPQEAYQQLWNSGIGTTVADLYIAWSYYYDVLNDFKNAEKIFQKGFDAKAEPLEELKLAHQQFSLSISSRMLYDDDSSKLKFKASMDERRNALTRLHTHREKFVGSIRTGLAVISNLPGTVEQNENANVNVQKNHGIEVLADEEEGATASGGVGTSARNVSVIRSIINSAKKKENVHEAGPWNKAKIGKKGNLFGNNNAPKFEIPEDDNLPPIPCLIKTFEKGIQLPSNWISQNFPQKPWDDVPIVAEEPKVERIIPMYDKFHLYPKPGIEISAEEFRGYLYFKKCGIPAPVVSQYDKYWENLYENGARIYPNFFTKNVPQVETDKIDTPIDEDGKEITEKLSTEELLAQKYQRGEIKILTEEDFEEIEESGIDMDLTDIGNRRESVYPLQLRKSICPRKSIVPRKSVAPSTLGGIVEENENSVELKSPSPSKSIVKKRRSEDGLSPAPVIKKELLEVQKQVEFKTPAPVEKKVIKPFQFEIHEDDNDNGNETCSTQQFNFFLQQGQLMSTPKSKKPPPSLIPIQTPEVKEDKSVEKTEIDQQQQTQVPEMRKQLSTIMETSEQQSSKFSSSQASSVGNETKTPSPNQNTNAPEIEQKMFQPLMTSFRLPEDQTETCAKIQPVKISRIPSPVNTKLAMSMKTLNVSDFELPETQPEPELSVIVPATQEMTQKELEVPEPEIDIPQTQEEQPKPADNFLFNIYEDTVTNIAPVKVPQQFQIGDEGTGYLHVSRKENLECLLASPGMKQKRTPSDEFLDLLKSPAADTSKKVEPKKSMKEQSDFMKFSQPSIEVSLNRLSLEQPKKSASPTTNMFDEDINTERFTLGNLKNSTLLPIQPKIHEKKVSTDFDLSLEFNEEERKHLGLPEKPTKIVEPEFKVPQLPAPIVKKPETHSFEVFNDDEDMSNSIYIPRESPVEDQQWHEEEDDENMMASFVATEHNQYEHTIIHADVSQLVQQAIIESNGNPFDERIRERMLESVNFTGYLEEHIPTAELVKIVPQLSVGRTIEIPTRPDDSLELTKLIGKGSFASVYAGKSKSTGEVFAVKQQRPANLWEFFVIVEVRDRLVDKRMLPAFMSIDYSIIGNNASIFLSQYSPHGTIIDVCNKYKNHMNRNLDELVVMVLASQLLNIIDHLHGCKIIHGDIKPDNFLFMNR